MELMGRKQVCNKVHFTILDINAASLARTILVFEMLGNYAIFKAQKAQGVKDAVINMAYVYGAHVIPAATNEKVQGHLKALISALESGEEIYSWLFVPEKTRREVVRVLKSWQTPMTGFFGGGECEEDGGKES